MYPAIGDVMSKQTKEYENRNVNGKLDSTANRKKVSKRARKRRKGKIAIFVVELGLLCMVILGLFGITQWDKIQKPSFSKNDIQTNDIDESVLKAMEGYRTYAVFGVDARDQTQLDAGNRSDTIMIVSVNNDTGDVRIVSVFRDTYLCVDDDNTYGKINGAYNTGGALNAINMLNKNLDLEIDGYVTVNWYAVAKTIDLLGGIEVNISEDIINSPTKGNMINSYIIETSEKTGMPTAGIDKAGVHNLTGVQAVAYSRIRYVSGGDYTRAEHQREVVGLMFEKAKTMSLPQLNSIMNEVLPNIQTNIEFTEALSLAKFITNYKITMGEGFPFNKTTKYMPYGKSEVDCVIPVNLEQNVAQLHEALYDSGETYVTSPEVAAISSKIEKASGIYGE